MKRFAKQKVEGILGVGRYVVERNGQEDPQKGNNVIAKVYVYLPANSQCNNVRDDIRFNALIAGDGLACRWGHQQGDERYKSTSFKSQKWRDAFADAEAWAIAQLEKLDELVVARKQAFEDAEF